MIVWIIITILVAVISYFIGRWLQKKDLKLLIKEERKDAIARSRAVLGGQFAEQLAPWLPDFPFNPNECKFLGKPIDFIVFEGMDEKNISKVVFVEVKSGNSRLNNQEKLLKDAVNNRRVEWVEYRIPKGITN